MNEKQLAENGYLHLECSEEQSPFKAAVREESDGRYTIALRDSEWFAGEGMTPGSWIPSDSFYLISNIRNDLYLSMRDKFTDRLKQELPLPCEWETFVRFSESGQLLVIAEYFPEAFLWDCQENRYPLDKVPQPTLLPNGDLDFSETLDYLHAWSRNQRRRGYTCEIRGNREECDTKERILMPMWGFDPDEAHYGNPCSFDVEEVSFKVDPKRAVRTVSLELGKSPNGFYAIGVDICLNRSGGGYAPNLWSHRGYASRDDALLAAIAEAWSWLEESNDDPKTITLAKKWLNARKKELAQPSLF